MKILLVFVAVVVGAYYAYNHFHNPTVIENPIYGELRIDLDVGSRKVNWWRLPRCRTKRIA